MAGEAEFLTAWHFAAWILCVCLVYYANVTYRAPQLCPECCEEMKIYRPSEGRSTWNEYYCVECDVSVKAGR